MAPKLGNVRNGNSQTRDVRLAVSLKRKWPRCGSTVLLWVTHRDCSSLLPAQDSEQRIPDLSGWLVTFARPGVRDDASSQMQGSRGGFVEGMSRECAKGVSAAGCFLHFFFSVTSIIQKNQAL